jgi:hypothetical protein
MVCHVEHLILDKCLTVLNRLAMSAFWHVLGRRQSKYGTVIAWLDTRRKWIERKDSKIIDRMRRMIRDDVPQEDDL